MKLRIVVIFLTLWLPLGASATDWDWYFLNPQNDLCEPAAKIAANYGSFYVNPNALTKHLIGKGSYKRTFVQLFRTTRGTMASVDVVSLTGYYFYYSNLSLCKFLRSKDRKAGILPPPTH